METAKVAQPISGDRLYQERARRALPLLVRQAQASAKIYYSDLADELGMVNPRNLNYVLGSIGQALQRLSSKWGEEVPPLQCLVVNKATGLPGEGVGWFIKGLENYASLSRKQQRDIVKAELLKISSYPKWQEVLAALGLKPVAVDYSALLKQASNYRGGGESEEHRRLKDYVAGHPELLNLPRSTSHGATEYRLPSGDSLDVLFRSGDDWIAVEVKSHRSAPDDIVRGLFQCIKYRAVIEAYQAAERLPQNARSVLILGGALPVHLIPLKNILEVEVMEDVVPA
jgi:hypothetical protein